VYLSTCRLTLATVLCGVVLAAAPHPAVAGQRPQLPEVSCRACFLIDGSGAVLVERSPDLRLPNASTTKMVTALLTLEEVSPSEVVTVSAYAASTGEAGLDLQPGDRYRVAELLYGLLMTSSNDAAVALAEHVSGTEADFVAQMNDYAAELGADNTHFVTPHGLDRPDHYSSARDLALIARELLAVPALERMVGTARLEIKGEVLENRNLLLESYRGAIGVKTGQTTGAGYVLVAAARRQGRTLIAVVMDSIDPFADSADLLDYGFTVLARTVVIEEGSPVGDIVFDTSGALPAVLAKPLRGPYSAAKLRPVIRLEDDLAPPIVKGERIGTITYMAGRRRVAVIPLVAGRELEAAEVSWATALLASTISLLSFLAMGTRP
jgi:serine-type D-Ala-D-Ala carboxypeptidase (penicillin-binding protein 5/6)